MRSAVSPTGNTTTDTYSRTRYGARRSTRQSGRTTITYHRSIGFALVTHHPPT